MYLPVADGFPQLSVLPGADSPKWLAEGKQADPPEP